jgi:hypothetical protein
MNAAIFQTCSLLLYTKLFKNVFLNHDYRKRNMLKTTINLAVVSLLVAFSTVFGQKIGIKGRVVDKNHNPVQGATVRLMKSGETQTTDWEGNFFIDMTLTHTLPSDPVLNFITFNKGVLSFNLSESQKRIQVDIFDNAGKRINKVTREGIPQGLHTINVLPDNVSISMYFVNLQIGNQSRVFKVLNLTNRAYSLYGDGLHAGYALMKKSATSEEFSDTLEIKKDDFEIKKIGINSYELNLNDIILDKIEAGLPPVTNGQSANTTRYWDCCKPHCGWHSNMRMCRIDGSDLNNQGAGSGCDGGESFQCWDYAPIEINSKVSYGWAAFNNGGTQCGDCFQLDFQGALQGKQMIVQVINIGDGGQNAFDLLIPGGGVGLMQSGCARQFPGADLGAVRGGFHASCGDNADCIRGMCQAAFGDKADLMRGCEWYINWFKMTSNPPVRYMKVSCPQEIKNISHIGN